jgi:hypothetical protein
LASRWTKFSLLYGVLGVAYWLMLQLIGKTPVDLLRIMPLAAGTAFAVLLVFWFKAMRRHHPPAQG